MKTIKTILNYVLRELRETAYNASFAGNTIKY